LVRQIDVIVIDVAVAPAFWRIETLDDRVTRLVEVTGGVLSQRVITTSYMAALPADPKMDPRLSELEALLAT
jgi:hypothetical protein